ncbi:uncharacterized protein LOC132604432 isoform X3 [Lycium barbarum]|uniref:uncharacterized protein LOC132604432 isoform X3 n=1 Tax=Lycium barbarum TaxID=112863 RepID=UPI00293F1BED|nr:uncharacterized protein LOC132604432 isoform X3 [Lycium barbarum]XP_060173914.1 uncharacterized protein LOC132604432 isoform X3 [Lycium barbarum]XP_060173915.1 uncharacterized protein LOC132604432 isoform X3 [Lycium barbarum]
MEEASIQSDIQNKEDIMIKAKCVELYGLYSIYGLSTIACPIAKASAEHNWNIQGLHSGYESEDVKVDQAAMVLFCIKYRLSFNQAELSFYIFNVME